MAGTTTCLPICLPSWPSPQYLCTAVAGISIVTSALHPAPCDAALTDIRFSSCTASQCSVRNLRRAIVDRRTHATSVHIPRDLYLCESSGTTIISRTVRLSGICYNILVKMWFSFLQTFLRNIIHRKTVYHSKLDHPLLLYFLLRSPPSIPYLPPLLLLSRHSCQALLFPFLGCHRVSAQIPIYLASEFALLLSRSTRLCSGFQFVKLLLFPLDCSLLLLLLLLALYIQSTIHS
jgi:hypothetical protein